MKDSSHWYKQDGTPCYEVPNKSRPGQMRSTTIRDARLLDLVPSVSTIGKIIYSHSLQNWIQEQIVKAAWEIKTDHECDYDIWAGKVYEKAGEISSTAADTGSAIHNAIEKEFQGVCVPEYVKWQNTFHDWWIQQDWFENHIKSINEGYISTEFGYGGRYDIFVIAPEARIIIDLKTQNTKGRKFTYYRSWGRQLAAYAQPLKATRLISVAMCSQDSSKIESYEWPDQAQLLAEFQASQMLWLSENNLAKKGDSNE